MNTPRSSPSCRRSLKTRALQWLAQREQSRIELRRKLMLLAVAEDREFAQGIEDTAGSIAGDEAVATAPRVPAAERVDALLDWLEAHRYLSLERFAESRVHARLPRFGNLRIRHELKQHQAVLSDEAARALNETEVERACAVLARKFGPCAAVPAERARRARFLAGRGFSPEAIGRALRQAASFSEIGPALQRDD